MNNYVPEFKQSNPTAQIYERELDEAERLYRIYSTGLSDKLILGIVGGLMTGKKDFIFHFLRRIGMTDYTLHVDARNDLDPKMELKSEMVLVVDNADLIEYSRAEAFISSFNQPKLILYTSVAPIGNNPYVLLGELNDQEIYTRFCERCDLMDKFDISFEDLKGLKCFREMHDQRLIDDICEVIALAHYYSKKDVLDAIEHWRQMGLRHKYTDFLKQIRELIWSRLSPMAQQTPEVGSTYLDWLKTKSPVSMILAEWPEHYGAPLDTDEGLSELVANQCMRLLSFISMDSGNGVQNHLLDCVVNCDLSDENQVGVGDLRTHLYKSDVALHVLCEMSFISYSYSTDPSNAAYVMSPYFKEIFTEQLRENPQMWSDSVYCAYITFVKVGAFKEEKQWELFKRDSDILLSTLDEILTVKECPEVYSALTSRIHETISLKKLWLDYVPHESPTDEEISHKMMSASVALEIFFKCSNIVFVDKGGNVPERTMKLLSRINEVFSQLSGEERMSRIASCVSQACSAGRTEYYLPWIAILGANRSERMGLNCTEEEWLGYLRDLAKAVKKRSTYDSSITTDTYAYAARDTFYQACSYYQLERNDSDLIEIKTSYVGMLREIYYGLCDVGPNGLPHSFAEADDSVQIHITGTTIVRFLSVSVWGESYDDAVIEDYDAYAGGKMKCYPFRFGLAGHLSVSESGAVQSDESETAPEYAYVHDFDILYEFVRYIHRTGIVRSVSDISLTPIINALENLVKRLVSSEADIDAQKFIDTFSLCAHIFNDYSEKMIDTYSDTDVDKAIQLISRMGNLILPPEVCRIIGQDTEGSRAREFQFSKELFSTRRDWRFMFSEFRRRLTL